MGTGRHPLQLRISRPDSRSAGSEIVAQGLPAGVGGGHGIRVDHQIEQARLAAPIVGYGLALRVAAQIADEANAECGELSTMVARQVRGAR
jgi:hypothetical protein